MSAGGILNETYRVAWIDLCYLRDNIIETLLTSLVGPLLYLLAFGFGIGAHMDDGPGYVAFIIPGIIALNTLSSTFSTVSMRVFIQRRFYMSFDEMLLCPIRVPAVVLGKCVFGVLRAMMSCTILLFIGYLLAPDILLSPWIFVIIFISSLMFSLLGLLGGITVKKSASLSLISGVFIVPMTFLCGTLFNVSDLPVWAGSIVYALPLTHVSQLMRSVMEGTAIPADSILAVLIYTAAFFLICWYLIKTNRC